MKEVSSDSNWLSSDTEGLSERRPAPIQQTSCFLQESGSGLSFSNKFERRGASYNNFDNGKSNVLFDKTKTVGSNNNEEETNCGEEGGYICEDDNSRANNHNENNELKDNSSFSGDISQRRPWGIFLYITIL